MKRLRKRIYLILVLIAGAGSVWITHKLAARFFSANRFDIQFQGSFSHYQKNRIQSHLQDDPTSKTKSLCAVVDDLQKLFPSIQSVAITQSALGLLHTRIKSVTPLFVINNDLVLANSGFLFSTCLFDRKDIRKLNCIDVSYLEFSDDTVSLFPETLFSTAKNISVPLFERYSISCETSSKWWLQDKQQKNFFILFCGTRLPNQKMIAACDKIKGTLLARNAFTARRARQWVADVRFDDQVILFRKTGGR